MLPAQEETQLIDQRSDARMNFRTKPRIKDAIQKAAALSGVDDSAFTMRVAYREALSVIAFHERTQLNCVDHEGFFAALETSVVPSEKLTTAFERHYRVIDSR